MSLKDTFPKQLTIYGFHLVFMTCREIKGRKHHTLEKHQKVDVLTCLMEPKKKKNSFSSSECGAMHHLNAQTRLLIPHLWENFEEFFSLCSAAVMKHINGYAVEVPINILSHIRRDDVTQ